MQTAGQRRINLIWERTQGLIAVLVTATALATAGFMVVGGVETRVDKAFQLLGNTLFVIIGFYFGRTNHQRTGGVGEHDAGR